MPNKYNFDVLPNNGITELKCIEEDCSFFGPLWKIPEDEQKNHFLTHFRESREAESKDGTVYEIRGDIRVQACRVCGNDFEQARRRGRPRLECEECKNV